MIIYIFILLLNLVVADGEVDCSLGGASCDSCMLAKPFCYWCDNPLSGSKCQGSKLLCSSGLVLEQCPAEIDIQSTNKWRGMLNILSKYQSSHENPYKGLSKSSNNFNAVDDSLSQGGKKEASTTSNADLKELLHKLLLLKLLRKLKNEGSSTLSDQERQLLYQLIGKTAIITTTTEAPTVELNNEISELLSLLEPTKSPGKVLITKSPKLKASQAKKVFNQIKTIVTAKPTGMKSLPNHEEEVSVQYATNPADSVFGVDKEKEKSNTTSESVNVDEDPGYCKLYEEIQQCNADHNCTWCNTFDRCMERTPEEYKLCVDNKERTLDKKYGIDRCFAFKNCGKCVADDKCYWCAVRKRCHTYPFIGYVPSSCGGDWFVKQCDVQFAVIIIVLPLIIILLAMVTFYFCLKYCYYRRKVLRVPLFEKPGVFDYRKDKKVYFVNPEDESSENEMEVEKMRKKYRLPLEREPLIDPNS